MTPTETRVTRLHVLPKDADLFSERAILVEIDDEAAGEFVVVRQQTDAGSEKIGINPEEWPALRSAINRMIRNCKPTKE